MNGSPAASKRSRLTFELTGAQLISTMMFPKLSTMNDGWLAATGWFERSNMMKMVGVLLASLLALTYVSLVFSGSGPVSYKLFNGFINTENSSSSDLLPSGFDPKSCISRTQSASYRKKSPFTPSRYLNWKLRRYENLHRRCGPNTVSYIAALTSLSSGHRSRSKSGGQGCRYIVWIPLNGLGNKILTITSAFLYALLTDRVLLVDHGGKSDVADLFCEPFPNTSWLLPKNFPLKDKFDRLGRQSPECFGEMLRRKSFGNDSSSSGFVCVDLMHYYNDFDKKFYRDKEHGLLTDVKWLILRSDLYFVPSLFLMTTFRDEISRMFPERSTVFHHLGRYLFHPTNQVWGLITRFYDAYLAGADERIGIQVRTFEARPGPFEFVMEQISSCIKQENLISSVVENPSNTTKSNRRKAVLVTSLKPQYAERLKTIYWLNAVENGEVVGVYQPSHEEVQQTEKSLMHNRKAWAEIYLLSLTDTLVTSFWSTFGYVAHGLGGLRPVYLYKAVHQKAPSPPCGRAMSVEPCFLMPPVYEPAEMVENVKPCKDVSYGLKLVDLEK